MNKWSLIAGGIFCLSSTLGLLSGCDKPDEAPRTPKVVTQKIAQTSEPGNPSKTEPPSAAKASTPKLTGTTENNVVRGKVATPEKPGDGAGENIPITDQVATRIKTDESKRSPMVTSKPESVSKPAASTVSLSKQAPEKTVSPPSPPDKANTGQQKAISLASVAPPLTSIGTSKNVYAYIPEGKIDPFAPLFREEKKQQAPNEKKIERRKRIPRTPLEKIDLSQLTLTGVIRTPGGNKAMVEESSGKGYVIKTGTGIGVNWGKVVEIRKDVVIVEEELQDMFGNWTKQTREMKLPKPIGE